MLALTPRVAAGIAPWRSEAGKVAAARRWVEDAVTATGLDRAAFVATAEDERVVGFAGVAEETALTGERQAYLGELVVAAGAEGSGVGAALVSAVGAWAIDRGLGLLVLDTGTRNERARRFYARRGFEEEAVKLTKRLGPPSRQRADLHGPSRPLTTGGDERRPFVETPLIHDPPRLAGAVPTTSEVTTDPTIPRGSVDD